MSALRLFVLVSVTMLLTACGGGSGGVFAPPAPLLQRQLDQPYEWEDAPMTEAQWSEWLAQVPQPDRPVHVVASVPEVWVVVKYTGREALASLYTVMPFPQAPALGSGEDVRIISTGSEGKIVNFQEPKEGEQLRQVEVEIDGTKATYPLSDLEFVLNGQQYETFDVATAKDDAGVADRKSEAIAKLKAADLVVLAGEGIDDWMKPLIAESGTAATVIDLSERMNRLMTQRPVARDAGEPRVRNGVRYETSQNSAWWMSLRPTSVAVDTLDSLLGHMVPGKAAEITEWRTKWLEELGSLDGAMAQFMLDDPKLDANSVIPRRVIIDTPNLAWFCYRWDMHIVDIINTDSTTPPTPERIKELQIKAKEQYVSMIITTAGYASPAAHQVAEGLTVEIMEKAPGTESTKSDTGEVKEAFDPKAKSVRVPVPVVELALGLNQAGKDTEDYVPFMLFNTQKLARKYKPIVDGLYRLKKWHEEKNKLAAQPAEEATTDAATPEPAPSEAQAGAKY